mgnify:CR=1 FL=1
MKNTAFEADPVYRIVDTLMLLLSALLFPLDDELQIAVEDHLLAAVHARRGDVRQVR